MTTSVDIHDIETSLWDAADELRANSHLKASEYSVPVLGLIFLKYADSRFSQLEHEFAGRPTGRREIGKDDFQARGVLFLPETSRFSYLIELREGENIGRAINDAMAAIEDANEELRGVLPRTYMGLQNSTLVTLPCTLWFLDRGKRAGERSNRVLFIDARAIYRQIDRAHREFLANVVRLYRGEEVETSQGSAELIAASFPEGRYVDVPGLCRTATIEEIEKQGWSLNPGRCVGVAAGEDDGVDVRVRLAELHEELETLNAEAAVLQERIAVNVAEMLR